MCNQGQGLLSHFYLGFVCCVLIRGPDIMLAFFRTIGPLVWGSFGSAVGRDLVHRNARRRRRIRTGSNPTSAMNKCMN